jgi:hypothetical protein
MAVSVTWVQAELFQSPKHRKETTEGEQGSSGSLSYEHDEKGIAYHDVFQ